MWTDTVARTNFAPIREGVAVMTGCSVNLIDRHVGSRVRRVEVGMSVVALAEALDATVREVEMFEEGTAHLDAERLLQVCRALDADVSFFYAGFGASAARKAPHLRLADKD